MKENNNDDDLNHSLGYAVSNCCEYANFKSEENGKWWNGGEFSS